MRDLKKAKQVKLEVWGKKDDIYILQYILGEILIYNQSTNREVKYSLTVRDEEGIYEALGTDDAEFILELANSIAERSKKEVQNE